MGAVKPAGSCDFLVDSQLGGRTRLPVR